ncbi:MAG: helix-turn-helix domain-containing protein [Bacteroidota bacterium]
MEGSPIILVLSCLGIAQALFLCLYVFTLKRGNRKAHLFLGLIILGLTIRIGKSIFNEYLQLEAWQRNLGLAGILLVGPSLWLYGNTLLYHSTKPLKKERFHFIPYVLFSGFCFAIPNRFDTLSLGIYYAVFLHQLIYILIAAQLGFNARKRAQQTVLVWYRNLVIGVAIIWLFYIGNVAGLIPFYIGGALCYTFLVYVFSFLLLQKHSFHLEKYRGHLLDQKTSQALMHSLQLLFQEEAVYLNPQITLSEVAQSIGSKPKMVSRVINESMGKNFSEFVNSYRVEKAKRLLSSEAAQHEKIAAIAYDSGFNNVTSFNIAFKASTNLTPSEFRKQAF